MTGSELRWSAAWTAEANAADAEVPGVPPGVLVVSAGADVTYRFDGLPLDVVEAALGWVGGVPVAARDGDAYDLLVEQLVMAGALVPPGPTGGAPLMVSVVDRSGGRAGDVPSAIATALDAEHSGDDPDLVVQVVAGGADAIDGPSLTVDVGALEHVVIGPHHLPGRSACPACLVAATTRRHDPAPIPPRPAAAESSGLIAALVAHQIDLIGLGRPALLNATLAVNLTTGESHRDPLLRSPTCPKC